MHTLEQPSKSVCVGTATRSSMLGAFAATLLAISMGAVPAFAKEVVSGSDKTPWLDADRSFEDRATALVARMTLEEKAAQMQNAAPAIERLLLG